MIHDDDYTARFIVVRMGATYDPRQFSRRMRRLAARAIAWYMHQERSTRWFNDPDGRRRAAQRSFNRFYRQLHILRRRCNVECP